MDELEETKSNILKQIEGEEPSAADHLKGLGFETSVNVATDAITTYLGWAPPLYAAANFLSAGAANYISQKHIRKEPDFSWGEFWGASALGTVPFMNPAAGRLTRVVGQPNSIQRAVVGGGALGLGYQTIEKGVDERRLPTPTEATAGALTGGIVGGGFTGAVKVAPELKKRLISQILNSGDTPVVYAMQKPKNTFQQVYSPISDFDWYKKRQFILNANVLGKGGTFDWYKFNRGLTPAHQRITATVVSTPSGSKINMDWGSYRQELVKDFEAMYPSIKRKPGYDPKWIEADHGVTLVQSMPIYHGANKATYDKIQQKFISRAYKPGDTVDNLTALDKSVHSLKTAYFNKLHGKDGKGFFTDERLAKFKPGPNWTQQQADDFRLEILDLYLDEIDKGQAILEKAQKVYHTLHTKEFLMPEEIVEDLTDIITGSSGNEVTEYTSRELRKILKDIDKEHSGAIRISLQDQIDIIRRKIIKLEDDIRPGSGVSQKAEAFKLNQIKNLEKAYRKLVNELTGLNI